MKGSEKYGGPVKRYYLGRGSEDWEKIRRRWRRQEAEEAEERYQLDVAARRQAALENALVSLLDVVDLEKRIEALERAQDRATRNMSNEPVREQEQSQKEFRREPWSPQA